MTFLSTYKIDETSSTPPTQKVTEYLHLAGVFDGGVISVLDQARSVSVLDSWRWLLGDDAVALSATSLGDIFFWSEKHAAVYFLEVQRGKSTFVDRDVDFFLNDFLVQDEVRSRVLQKGLFDAISDRLGILRYGECYIAEPWLRLGGSGDPGSYQRGDLTVYVNLVGQSVEQTMRSASAVVHR
jgi:hypothetical protein